MRKVVLATDQTDITTYLIRTMNAGRRNRAIGLSREAEARGRTGGGTSGPATGGSGVGIDMMILAEEIVAGSGTEMIGGGMIGAGIESMWLAH